MHRALVTGATGFVGSNLVGELLARGWSVRALVRDPSRAQHLAERGAELCPGSLQDDSSLASAVTDVEFVFHIAGRVAAIRRQDFFLDNVEGTRALMKACRDASDPPTVVMVSSLAAGGPTTSGMLRRESDPPQPVSVYGESKLAAECAASEFAAQVPLSIIRPPVVFGPGDRNSLQLFKSIQTMRLHLVPGFREMPMSIVHIDDLCHALIDIALKGERVDAQQSGSGIYYVTSGPTITYGEMGRLTALSLGRRVFVLPTPKFVFWFTGGMAELVGRIRRRPGILNWDKMREATATGWECSDEKLRQQLGYAPTISIEQRFIDTAKWYRDRGWL